MRDSKRARDIHIEAVRNFDRIQSAMYQERTQSLEDRRFYSIEGAQWEGALSDQFENKPMLEVNKVHLAVMKIINEYRNNRITVNFVSKDGTRDDKAADVCDGLYRADEQDSGAEEAYDNAFEEAVGGGFGAFRLITSYEDEEDDENENQRIRIEPIYDADSSVFFDLGAKRQDKADAKYCFVMYAMTPEDYEAEYGEVPSSVSKEISNIEYDWFSPDMVYIAEYYLVEEVKDTVHIFQNITGDEVRVSEEELEDNPDLLKEFKAIGTKKIREKKTKRKRIHKYILSGDKILEDCGYIAGKNIPVVPVYGKRWFVDSVERCMGHVRLVKDSQRLKNMLTSKLAEISSLSTVEKPIFTPEQVSQNEVMWAEDNIKNYPYMLVNPITDGSGNSVSSGPIGYTKVPQIPPALAALLQQIDVDMKELLGGSAETDKMLSHVSGKAHELIQKRIDGQAYIYMSNFSKAIRRAGEIWLSQAKDVYVEKGRKMKTIDRMGQTDSVELLQPGLGPKGEVTEVNDLSKATFDVAVDIGPSSLSQREATVNTLMGMLQITQDPETAQVLQSMALMNMEGDGISEARDFFRKRLVRMGVVKPTEEEAQQLAEAAKNAKPDPQERVLNAMASESEAKAAKAQTEVAKVMTEAEKNQAQTMQILSETDVSRATLAQDILEREREEDERQRQAELQRQQAMVQSLAQQQPSAR